LSERPVGSRRRSLSEVRRIGIVGGTGPLGRGLAARLSYKYDVLIGSREERRARGAAEEVTRLTGRKVRWATNLEAARASDTAILALPDQPTSELIQDLKEELDGKLVISPIVPMEMTGGQGSSRGGYKTHRKKGQERDQPRSSEGERHRDTRFTGPAYERAYSGSEGGTRWQARHLTNSSDGDEGRTLHLLTQRQLGR